MYFHIKNVHGLREKVMSKYFKELIWNISREIKLSQINNKIL